MSNKRNQKGQFAEGNTGRPKGSLGKNSMELRTLISNFLTTAIPKVIEDFNDTKSPRDRRDIVLSLLQYVLPKLRNTDNEGGLGHLSEKELNYIIETIKKSHYENIEANSN